jgi:hypothetical protein
MAGAFPKEAVKDEAVTKSGPTFWALSTTTTSVVFTPHKSARVGCHKSKHI